MSEVKNYASEVNDAIVIETEKKVADIKEKIKDGFYNKPEVIEKVAEEILKDMT